MCGCPAGGKGWPGGAQCTPRGPTTGVSTLKQVHPALLSWLALSPPVALAAVADMASDTAISDGTMNLRIPPPFSRLTLARCRRQPRILTGKFPPRQYQGDTPCQ